MDVTIQFSGVSKKYNLGMTRTSIPVLVSTWAKFALHRTPQENGSGRTFWAVRDVSFELIKGESLALIGPNGAGKTTILKLLAQITKPTTGKVDTYGKLSALIELGAGFHPELSGRENIYLNGLILGLKRDEIKNLFDEIVAFSELEQFIDTPLKRYSSGMAVRLGFAVAATINPDILLVDEVLAVGDASFRLKCIQRIEKLLRNGTTLIFVSHNMDLVKSICRKSIYLDHGQLIFYGDTSEAIDIYTHVLNENRKVQFSAGISAQETGLDALKITAVDLIGQNGSSGEVLYTSQPARIAVKYIAHDVIGDCVVVLRIIRTDGVSCSVMYSSLDNTRFSIKKGAGIISARLTPLQLFPGMYYVAVTIKSSSEAMTLALERSEWFEVKGEARGYQDRDAVFESNRHWEHEVDQPAGFL